VFALDSLIFYVSGFVTYWVFFRGYETLVHFYALAQVMLIYLVVSWLGMRLNHTYAGILRYSSFVDLRKIVFANMLSFSIAVLVHFGIFRLPPTEFVHLGTRHLLVIFILATSLMCSVRVVMKSVYEVLLSSGSAKRCFVYGTMAGGVALAKSIRANSIQNFDLRGFITHEPHDSHARLMGVHVYGPDDNLKEIIEREHIEAVVVSPMRNKEFRNDQNLQDLLMGAEVKMYMVHGMVEMDSKDGVKEDDENFGNLKLQEVSVEDLLPRDEIKVDMEGISSQLRDKHILITGSAGSIGSEIVRQVACFQPAALMLIDQAETPEHDIRLMMNKDFPGLKAETVVTSICKQDRMEEIFSQFKPDHVFHAAAYKHVPMMEDNPSEAVQNNVLGTKILADLSVKYGVKKFVMVSTDKAVNPTNVMGCSKRICEIYVQSLNNVQQTTQFVTTRFGNVLGSSGSVIPLFRQQIKNGGPVTVTHPDITRFFMLIPEACKLVLEAGIKGHGGEIFVFDMGKPVKISVLAQRMINLSGVKDVKIKYTGLRPGEKLYEEVLNEEENTKPTFHEKIRIANVRNYDYTQVCKDIDDLIAISHHYDNMATVRKMKDIVPEYKSNNSVYESLDVPPSA